MMRKVELFDQVDYEECSLVGYTECTTEETTQDLRDDQVTIKSYQMSKMQRFC